ncbi:MAG TPA: hypothetical protein VFV33_00555 [Gemmatimonadaceae bacterium]|nr:hypothetical protein [Gemmatimonadaceae bacterium]
MQIGRAARVVVLLTVIACQGAPSSGALTAAHAAAMRDSVQQFLASYAADISAPPVGKKAREAVAGFYAPDLVMSTDLAPDTPVLVQTVDSLIPPDEVVSVPPFIRATKLTYGRTIITPLAPGIASFTALYREQVTDSSGTVTDLPGVQHGVVRHDASGWRFASLQSAHPMAMHQAQAAMVARVTSPPPTAP